jgi:branched-chain amino acid aminotransferase
VFSTIRVADGVLFAFERHWARMKRDAELMHVPFPESRDAVRSDLLRLVQANGSPDATLRMVVVRNHGGLWEGPGIDRDYDLIALTANLTQWGAGVRLGLIANARHSACGFTGTKILTWSHNLIWYEEAHQRGFDEVILLNERGELSECTSANIFLAEGNTVWTPPLRSGCLPGVTRELLLQEIRVPGIQIAERELAPADLERADGVFISSTTRDLLPVVSVEGLTIRNDDRCRAALQNAFTEYRQDYVVNAKREPLPA